MGYDGKSLFECVRCPMCACRRLPPYGIFTVGLDYAFDYIIDAMKVTDNLGKQLYYQKLFSFPVLKIWGRL